ncbi:MAG: TIGR02996 domain-containing protein [Gemmataceae bacterium]|nr:TIGR02996 domain-containing protein [Gemmataceae bacterium]
MRSHPDADAFVRAFLRNPKDETSRLVFADWLEDTGEPHNAAWAGYIRAKAAAARYEFGRPEWRTADREAGRFADHVRANLDLPVRFFLGYPASVLRLIPGPNITVRLDNVLWPSEVVGLVPDPLAREHSVVALQTQGPALLVAAADLRRGDLVQMLEFVLDRPVVGVRAGHDEIQAAIDRTHGEYEFFDPSVRFVGDRPTHPAPLIGLEGDRDAWVIGGLFTQVFEREAEGFELELRYPGCRVYDLPRLRPTPDDEVGEDVFHRLLAHLNALPRAGGRVVAGGWVGHPVDLPVLTGRPLPVAYQVRLGERPARRLRVLFRPDRREP